jgi:hypothetical protein
MFKFIVNGGNIPITIISLLIISLIIFLIILLKKPEAEKVFGNEIKCPLTSGYEKHINKNSFITNLDDLISTQESIKPFVFYTYKRWNVYNNTYVHDTSLDNYYIVEPGYYYYINGPVHIYSDKDNTEDQKNDTVIKLINLN